MTEFEKLLEAYGNAEFESHDWNGAEPWDARFKRVEAAKQAVIDAYQEKEK